MEALLLSLCGAICYNAVTFLRGAQDRLWEAGSPMDPDSGEVDALLRDVGRGDATALRRLLELHRDRLRRVVSLRLDPRLAPRLDPSDVVQEALAEAAGKLDDYLRDRSIPLFPWLRRLALEQVIRVHRANINYGVRSVLREGQPEAVPPDGSTVLLAERFVDSASSPSRRAARNEEIARVHAALARLSPALREVLVLRYLEQLSFKEVAAVIGATEGAAKVRHFRALEKVRSLLNVEPRGDRHGSE